MGTKLDFYPQVQEKTITRQIFIHLLIAELGGWSPFRSWYDGRFSSLSLPQRSSLCPHYRPYL